MSMLAFEQKRASEHLHQYMSLYKCLIFTFKRYGVNIHNLLTTSYFFDESGCEYSWINWLSEKIKSSMVFMVNNLYCCDPYVRMVSILK